ncbi:MAG: hypothetical protein JWM91_2911 [Rhodospirillales bacterium]|nr:hypothetical protein [Rhodospirillales bacterium]
MWVRIIPSDTKGQTSGRGRAAELAPSCRAAVTLSFLLTLIAFGPLVAAPYTPQKADEIVAELPSASSPAARRAFALHNLLRRAPDQLELALKTAQTDIDLARALSDPRYNGYAESALAPWWALNSPPVEVILLRATIKQSRHDFEGALRDLNDVLQKQPDNAQALLTRAVVRQVQGDFLNARADCGSLSLSAPDLIARTCVDSVSSLNGQGNESLRDLAAVYDAFGGQTETAIALFSLTILAEMAERLGEYERAEQYFRRATALSGQDGYLLAAYADFLLDRNRPSEVVTLLRNQTRVDPLLLRLALAEQQLGAKALATDVKDLQQRFAVAAQRGDRVHQREQARFELFLMKRPQEALRLALANWNVQHEPADLRVLLEAAKEADPAAARPAIIWLNEARLEDEAIEKLVRQINGGGG